MDKLEKQYEQLINLAEEHGLCQTLKALPYAREKHEGMFRKGPERMPYIIHPVTMATHAISMGILDDDLLATALLHDVCEDCGVTVEELPVGNVVKRSVALLTKKEGFRKNVDNPEYYRNLSEDKIASIVKILDRCNNVSGMSTAFSLHKIGKYALETETYIYPLIDQSRKNYPDMERVLFIMEYHIRSVLEAVYSLLNQEKKEEKPKIHMPDSMMRA